MQGAFRDALIFITLVVVFMAVALFALRGPIVALFQADGVAKDLVYLFCGPLALLFFFNGAIFVANAAFNNLGHPFYSTWINWGRHTLGTIPFVIIGASLWGAEGVLLGQAFGGVVFGLVALWLGRRVMAKAAEGTVEPKDAPFARQGRLHGLFHLRR